MTCIVGYIDKAKRKMYVGGDSAAASGHRSIVRKDAKVFVKKNMIFGFTSSFRMGQLIRYSFDIPHKQDDLDDYEYMCSIFINSIRDVFKKGGYTTVENNKEDGGTFLVAYNGEIYIIYDDFQVAMHSLHYSSIGCGEAWANGALYKKIGKPEEIINNALDAASYFSGWVRPPYNIISLSY